MLLKKANSLQDLSRKALRSASGGRYFGPDYQTTGSTRSNPDGSVEVYD